MKKFLFLAIALMMSVCGAWADNNLVASTTEASPEHQYRLRPRNTQDYWLTAGLHAGNEAAAGKFAFFEADGDGNYYVYSVDEGQWLTYTSATNGANKVTLSNTKSSYFNIAYGTSTGDAWGDKTGFTLKASSATVYMNFYQGPTSNNYTTTGTIGFWQEAFQDAGSVWVFDEVEFVTTTYTISVVGAPSDVTVTVDGVERTVGTPFDLPYTINESAVTTSTIPGYKYNIVVSGNTITITYTEVPTMKDYNSWDVSAKGSSAITTLDGINGKYIAILGMDQQSLNRYYLYDNGTKIQGKEWALYPELVWFVTEGATSGKYILQNFKTGKYMNVPGNSNGAALNMSNTPVELNFVISGGYACINNGSQGIDVGWAGTNPTTWAGTTPDGSRRLQIFDVELATAAPKAQITYNYVIDGVTFDSETYSITIGEAFPALTKSFYGYTISGQPEGTVAEDATYSITLSDFAGPFVPTTLDGDKFAADTKWYYMENGDNKGNGYAVYGSDSKSTFTTTAGTTDAYKWTFVRKTGTPYFYLYNKAAGVVAMREQLSTNSGYASSHNQGFVVANGTDLEMPLQVYQNNDGFALKLAANEGTCLLGKHVGSNLSIWGNSASLTDNGSRFVFTKVPVDWADLEATITEAEAIPYGDQLGQYSNPDFASELTEAKMMLAMHQGGISADYEQLEEKYYDLLVAINNLTLNLPEAGRFLVIQGTTGGKYMNGRELTTNESVMWYGEDNKLITFSTGYGFKNTSENATVTDEANAQTFAEAQTIGTYFIISNATGVGQYMYENDNNVDRYSTNPHDRKRWNVSYATALPVAFHSAGLGYATLYAPVALEIPAGITAYVVSAATDHNLKLTALENKIPANTAVILEGGAGTVNFPITTADAFEDDNLLAGTIATIAAPENSLVLAVKNGAEAPGFYGAGATVAGFKAYYEAAAEGVNGLAFDFGTESIQNAINALQGGRTYDLQGRQVNNNVRGLFIQNGKKVIK